MLNVKKANLLKDQVGTGSADTKIWKRAVDLYSKANLLATEPKLSSNNELKGLVEALATAVGASEHVEGLQKALKALKDATESDNADLVKKAEEVVSKYDAVKDAYDKVKAKETQYKSTLNGSEESKYTEVETKFDGLKTAYNNAQCKTISLILDKEMIRYCSISLYTYPYHNPNLNLLKHFLY
ncbi:Tpr-like protein [Theileria parva strain Muguga]|uniref:Uncharacterized protein n=1 Tax=Theileria parva TaxID=5875 RepID=Q4N3Y8_THEPA|nr:Tpr-like protein [Theileria parva strain Muguga]EAN33135.1 Tpr-like protein [Theileria parva strain Muguga]|eukprot:XP_765418.1 hypothetical protein [Theileria parva strain Muguga]